MNKTRDTAQLWDRSHDNLVSSAWGVCVRKSPVTINMSAKLSNANKFTVVDTLVSTQGNDRTLSHTVTQPFKTFVYKGILEGSKFVFFRNSLSHSLVSICATIGMIFSNSPPHAEKVQWDHSPRITHSRFLCLQLSHQFVHVFFADF